MKYRILCFIIIIPVLLLSLFLSKNKNGLISRTHQHLAYKEKTQSEQDKDVFWTHLPIIKLDMDGQEPEVFRVVYENGISDSVSADIKGTVEVIDNEEQNNHLADQPSMRVLSNIRVRGNSSKQYNKKNYKLSFIYEDGSENKQTGLLGMEPHDEWALHGPYLDRTMIRNYLCMNITGQVLPYTPDVRFCELFVNGEYRGLYVAMETIARGRGRVDIKRNEDGDKISSYLLQQNWYIDSPNTIEPFTWYTKMADYSTSIRIMYPGSRLTPEIKESITQEISSYEKALYSFDYNDPVHGYQSFYDVGSFVDYAIINEFFQNGDAGSLSTYFYKDLRGKLHIGPVWDFNNAFDNFNEPVPDFTTMHSLRYNMLIKDKEFVERLIRRYRELRKTVLSEDYLFDYIDDTVAFIEPALERNFEVWPDTFDYEIMQDEIRLDYEWRNPKNYEEAVDKLKEFIKKRGSWLDKHIETLRQFCHESATKKHNR